MNASSQNGPTTFLEIIRLGSDVLLWVMAVIIPILICSFIVRRKLRPTAKNDTVLLAHTFQDATDVIPSRSSTTSEGLYWQYLIGATFNMREMRGVYSVELPFHSGVHLLGIPKVGEDFDISTTGSVMESVVLEGDYPNYFSLYADKGQQSGARFVLDPKAMVFTVDFCRQFSWEIVEDSLYFASEGTVIPLELIDRFVKDIRPAIETPSGRTTNPQLEMPYTHFEGRVLNCPVCTKKLTPSAEWLGCPDGHGVLVTASQLSSLRNLDDNQQGNGVIEHNIEHSGDNLAYHEGLVCPYCHARMQPTQFAFTKVEIDVCSKCMFRWLDAGEAKRLFVS